MDMSVEQEEEVIMRVKKGGLRRNVGDRSARCLKGLSSPGEELHQPTSGSTKSSAQSRPHSINTGSLPASQVHPAEAKRRSAQTSPQKARFGGDGEIKVVAGSQDPNVPDWKPQSFVSRDWLYENIEKALENSDNTASRGVLLVGKTGSGKTALLRNLVHHLNERSETATLENDVSSAHEAALGRLSDRIVAHHFCNVNDNLTCLLPEFVRSLIDQMSFSLPAYRRLIAKDKWLLKITSMDECIRDPDKTLLQGIAAPLTRLQQLGRISSDVRLVIVDSLDAAEHYRTECTQTIASFLTRHISRLPRWLRLVVTVRSEQAALALFLPLTIINLEDVANSKCQQQDLSRFIKAEFEPIAGIPMRHADALSVDILEKCEGNFLYVRVLFDLLHSYQLDADNMLSLPRGIKALFHLAFSLRFASLRNWERASQIFSILLASSRPLSTNDVLEVVTAARITSNVTHEDINKSLQQLEGLIVRSRDDKWQIVHPCLREWLLRRDTENQQHFLCDVRFGHAHLALRLSRFQRDLSADEVLEFGHHLLKAEFFSTLKDIMGRVSSQHLQCLWVSFAANNLPRALLSHRNLFAPNLKVSELLLSSGANANYRHSGWPALCLVARAGWVPLMQLLIKFGAHVHSATDGGLMPLHLAAANGHLPAVQFLLDNAAQMCMVDGKGRCALIHASANGHLSVVRYLLGVEWKHRCDEHRNHRVPTRSEAIHQALVSAASKAHSQVCEQLIMSSPEMNLDLPDSLLGETALTAACSSGDVNTVISLLQYEVAVTSYNKKSQTALHVSSRLGHSQIVECLITAGSDIESRDSYGRSALILTAAEGRLNVITALLSRGASINAADQRGMTSAIWACIYGHLSVLTVLSQHGADLEAVDCHRRSAIHFAAQYGHDEIVQYLIEHGVDLERQDSSNMRALEYAIGSGNVDTVSVCLRRGSKLTQHTWEVAGNKPEMCILLLNKLAADGNTLFKKNRITEAMQRYSYALRKLPRALIPGATNMSPEHKLLNDELAQLKLHLLLNLSRCRRRTGQFESAVQLATKAVNMKCNWHEAYYARARANRDAGNIAEAESDLILGLKLAPDNSDMKRLLQRIRDQITSETESINSSESVSLDRKMPYKVPSNKVPSTDNSLERPVHQPSTITHQLANDSSGLCEEPQKQITQVYARDLNLTGSQIRHSQTLTPHKTYASPQETAL